MSPSARGTDRAVGVSDRSRSVVSTDMPFSEPGQQVFRRFADDVSIMRDDALAPAALKSKVAAEIDALLADPRFAASC